MTHHDLSEPVDPAVTQPPELRTEASIPHISRKAAEIAVAAILLLAGLAVLRDSFQVGAGWSEGLGPETGFFPARVAMLFLPLSLFVLFNAVRRPSDEIFITLPQALHVARVLVPLCIYVWLIGPLGIYVASALFIAGFMLIAGGMRWYTIPLTAIALPVIAFWVFEMQFQVPLPKGPLEAALGF